MTNKAKSFIIKTSQRDKRQTVKAQQTPIVAISKNLSYILKRKPTCDGANLRKLIFIHKMRTDVVTLPEKVKTT